MIPHGSNAIARSAHSSASSAASSAASSLPCANKSIARLAISSRLRLYSTCLEKRSMRSTALGLHRDAMTAIDGGTEHER